MSGEGFRSRLKRLRREVPRDGEAVEDASVAERLRAHRRRRGGRPADGEAADPVASERVPTTVGEPRDLTIASAGRAGELAARIEGLAGAHHHGTFRLDEIEHADPADFVLLTGDSALAELDLGGVVYLDTETTGLSGGAGTYVFQIGLGTFTADGGFELWQGFLRGPGEERALLAECAARIARSSGVVSFFGKSFDRHRLEDKMRVCGVEPPFERVPHLDLYHPCRRLYAPALPDGRLQTMERALCGVEREDDLPGSFAPAAWFDYLAERPHRLEAIFRHNRDDVLSLVTLAAHLGRSRRETRGGGEALTGDEAARARGVARSLRAAGEKRAALEWIDEALGRVSDHPREWLFERADLQRLCGARDGAIETYRELIGGAEDRYTTPALLELAKLLEHHRRDFAGAVECCELARTTLDRNHVGPEFARLSRDLGRRLERTRARLHRGK